MIDDRPAFADTALASAREGEKLLASGNVRRFTAMRTAVVMEWTRVARYGNDEQRAEALAALAEHDREHQRRRIAAVLDALGITATREQVDRAVEKLHRPPTVRRSA